MKITKQYAKEFDEKCARVDAHGFLRFVSKPYVGKVSILNGFSLVQDTIKFVPAKPDKEVELSENEIVSTVNEFFSRYLPNKAEEVSKILNKTHSYFIDSVGTAHVNFVHVTKDDPRASNVGHNGRSPYLEFNVYLHGTVDDLRVTAHELAHALSAHHQHVIEELRKDDSVKISRKTCEQDCIGEIESLIVEQLFNRFLVEKGIYSKEDLQNYERQQKNSLLGEINLIKEERDIIKNLSCPVTYESLSDLVENLQKNNNKRLLSRVENMHDGRKSSPYMFRYVVGRIFANQWIERFDNAKNEDEQKLMLSNFESYLSKTDKLDLDSACQHLFQENCLHVVEDYVICKQDENKKVSEKRL